MKIDNNDVTGASGIRTPATDLQQRVKTPLRPESEPAAPIDDSVQTSAIASAAAGDPAKVERLREAVRAGTYSVDPKEVAAKIIGEHLVE
jgi:anti-sigma28 factor (negative regulator of flagellin synthesis)